MRAAKKLVSVMIGLSMVAQAQETQTPTSIAVAPEATQAATEILAVDLDSDLNGITDELLQKVAAQEARGYHALHPNLAPGYPHDAAKAHHLTDPAKINTFVKAFEAAFGSNVPVPPVTPLPLTPGSEVQRLPTTEHGLVTGSIFIFEILIPGLLIYFFPFIIAAGKRKTNAPAIFALNLLLGWTFIGWVAALVWALTNPESKNK
jgi:T4 superinfection immunity protein